jgi:(E)-4-hydroxy-3-methylbut-2-enyl-diphosphate synthase
MANTSTNDIEGSVAQAERCIEAGAELVRFTTQGIREVDSLAQIYHDLSSSTPLVADVHFQSDVADAAAQVVEKVRINPGNYIDPARKFKQIDYTNEEYLTELERLRNRFVQLLNICKKHKTALRIGVNHGSLSDRIMSRYGDTPEGMVESCMEFLRVAVAEDFKDIVLSIKASNTRVMVTTVRLLVWQMQEEGMAFPLHLGVTEAGEGEDRRVKSAVGIGALLADRI